MRVLLAVAGLALVALALLWPEWFGSDDATANAHHHQPACPPRRSCAHTSPSPTTTVPSPTASPTSPPSAACFAIVSWGFGPNLPRGGQQLIEGTVRNQCPQPVAGIITLTALRSTDPRAPVFGAGLSTWLGTVPAAEQRTFQIPAGQVPPGSYTAAFQFTVQPAGTQGYGLPCWDDGTGRCLFADARLEGAIAELRRVPPSRQLLALAAGEGVTARVSHLPPGILGQYSHTGRLVEIDDRLLGYGARAVAAVLAHEYEHAAQGAAGRLGGSSARCYENEEDAFRREGEVWAALWGNQLPAPTTSIEVMHNDIARLRTTDPYQLIKRFLASYGHVCGGQPPGSTWGAMVPLSQAAAYRGLDRSAAMRQG